MNSFDFFNFLENFENYHLSGNDGIFNNGSRGRFRGREFRFLYDRAVAR